LQKGKWNGKQIVPQAWVEEATSFKIDCSDPANKAPKELNDWQQGYGYQFWRCRNNAFRADGLGGQFIIVLPERDAVVVLTCSAASTQEELNLVWDHLLPAIHDKRLAEDKKGADQLTKRIASLSVRKTVSSDPTPGLTEKISGKRIGLSQNDVGLQAITLSTAGSGDIRIQLHRDNEEYEIISGRDFWKYGQTKLFTMAAGPRPSQVNPVNVASRYTWTDPLVLELTSKFLEESIGSEVWSLRFEDSGSEMKVHVEIKGARPRTMEGKVTD